MENQPKKAPREYHLKHVPELWKRREGFTDARGGNYSVAPDGSLRRLDKKLSKKKRRQIEAERKRK